jgi:MFS family permease
MWLFPLSFFTYQFILRLWPGLMMHSLMNRFSIGASDFGLLAAFYYYGYAGMQIPVAILLDRFGPRVVMLVCALLCGGAALVFIETQHFYVAIVCRFLIGAGSAAGFLGVSKVVSQWFPKAQYASWIGISFTVGFTGAIYGGKPVVVLIERYTADQVAWILAWISIGIGVMTYCGLRAPPTTHSPVDPQPWSLKGLVAILKSPTIWILGFSNLLMVGALEGFADVWGVQYLMTAYGLTKSDAAGFTSFIFVGILFGGPLLAFLSQRLGHYSVIVLSGLGMAFCFWVLLWAGLDYHPVLLTALLLTMGIFCCYQVVVFAAGSDAVASAHLGITVAFLNCINMLGGSFFHTGIGRIIDWVSPSSQHQHYGLETYRLALTLIPASAALGGVLVACLGFYVHRQKR